MWLILAALCGAVLVEARSKYVVRQSIQDVSTRKPVRGAGTTPDLCPTCIEFTDQTINELVNIIGSKFCTSLLPASALQPSLYFFDIRAEGN